MIKEHFNQGWVRYLGASAVTFGNHIFYEMSEDRVRTSLRRHEHKHVEQYKQYGIIRFLVLYLFWYLKGRINGLNHWDAYDKIPFEIEAVKAQKEV